MVGRFIFTIIAFVFYIASSSFWRYAYPQYVGIAGAARLNDDSVSGNALSRMFSTSDTISVVLFWVFITAVLLIWWKPLSKLVSGGSLLLVIMLLSACSTQRATNQSESYGTPDVVQVLPNQSAFVIPATGGNKANQDQFDSVSYLQEKKVAIKQLTIDKQNIGQKYVPTSFVVLVDRTPVSRHWTKAGATGTSTADQSLCGETSESIEVCFQVATSASIQDKDAATYLFNFPSIAAQREQVAGVFIATSLGTVVDNQVRQYVQKLIGAEESRRTLDKVIADKLSIIDAVEKQTQETFAKRGITVEYVGLGGELSFDTSIQSVINEQYVASKNIIVAQSKATAVSVEAGAYANAAQVKGNGDASAMKALKDSLGDSASLGSALEGYRWNGDRTTVRLDNSSRLSVPVPVPTNTPVPAPKPSTTPAPEKKP